MLRFVCILAVSNLITLTAAKNLISVVKKDPSHGKIVVCTTSISPAFKDSKFKIENVDLKLCTHLICIDNIWDKSIEPWISRDSKMEAHYKWYTNLRTQYPHLKVSLAVKHTMNDYKRHAANPERRKRYIEKGTDFILSHKFDGLDLIWDFSEQTGVTTNEKEILQKFMKDLMSSFETQNLLLTATFIGLNKMIVEKLDIPSLSEHFDRLHFVQKYNFVETWPGSYRVEDVLKERNVSSLMEAIDKLIEFGVAPEKLILGLQFVGLSFHAVLDLAPKSATFRRTMSYDEICRTLSNDKKSEWQKFYDDGVGLAIAKDESKSWRGILKSTNVIVYESSRSIANKIQFAVDRKLGGAMAFPIEMDDFRGNCGIEEDVFDDFNLGTKFNISNRHNVTHSLLKTINFAFEVAPYATTQARTPNKDKIYYEDNRINEIDSDADVTAMIPEQYKPFVPFVFSVNDAMVVGYDKMKEKAELYEKDQTYKNLMFFYMMKLSRLLFFVLSAALFGRFH